VGIDKQNIGKLIHDVERKNGGWKNEEDLENADSKMIEYVPLSVLHQYFSDERHIQTSIID